MLSKTALLTSVLAAAAARAAPEPQQSGTPPTGSRGGAGGLGSLTSIQGIMGILGDDPAGTLGSLLAVPGLTQYIPYYLSLSGNKSEVPFVSPIPVGPAPTGCNKYEILVARGTGEQGPLGFIVGDPLLKAVQKTLPEARGYAVQYPANSAMNSLTDGIKDTVNRLNSQSKACPDQLFSIVGYSQGAGVMHAMFSDKNNPISDGAFKAIRSAVTFGDPAARTAGAAPSSAAPPSAAPPTAPGNGTGVGAMFSVPQFPPGIKENQKINCATGDPICASGTTNIIAHLTYDNPGTTYIPDSAKFIVDHFK